MLDPEQELVALLAGTPMVDIEPFSSNYSVRAAGFFRAWLMLEAVYEASCRA